MITLFFLILLHSQRCFQTHINSLQDFFRHVINTATVKNFTANFTTTTMETAEYWLMAHEYATWNAAITSL